MANMIDLDSFRELCYYSNFDTHSLYVLELMENIFGAVPINFVKIEPLIDNEKWLRFNIFSDVNFTLNSLSSRVYCVVIWQDPRVY